MSDTVMRKYECEYYSLSAPATSCFFCDHCTDIFFDFSHGPYMFFCELDEDVDVGLSGKCKTFKEDGANP